MLKKLTQSKMEMQLFLDVNCVVGKLNIFCPVVYINGDAEGNDKVCGKYYKCNCQKWLNTMDIIELQLFVDVSSVVRQYYKCNNSLTLSWIDEIMLNNVNLRNKNVRSMGFCGQGHQSTPQSKAFIGSTG